MAFHEIPPIDIKDNFFERIGRDWMLVGAGVPGDFNAMTASWGQLGQLWNKPVVTVYVRPQRYTRDFMEKFDHFSLSFFAPGAQRRALEVMGTKSGRDGDKIAEAGLSVTAFGPDNTAAFAEANLVLVCRTLYKQDLEEGGFVDAAPLEANYPARDLHRMYVGQVEHVFIEE